MFEFKEYKDTRNSIPESHRCLRCKGYGYDPEDYDAGEYGPEPTACHDCNGYGTTNGEVYVCEQ